MKKLTKLANSLVKNEKLLHRRNHQGLACMMKSATVMKQDFHSSALFRNEAIIDKTVSLDKTIEETNDSTVTETTGDVFVDDFLIEEVTKESEEPGDVITDMKKNVFDTFLKSSNFEPNIENLNKIMSYLKVEVDQNGMECNSDNELKQKVFKQLTEFCAFNRRVNEEHLLDTIKSLKSKHGILPVSSILGVLIKFYEERGCLKEAISIIENEMVATSTNENLIHTAMSVYGRAKNIERVEELFQKIHNPNGRHYATLVYAYVNSGMMEKAHEITVKLKGSKHLTADVFAPILNHHVKNNNLDLALRFFHEMPEMGIKRMTSTYSILITSACANDRNDLVSFLFSHMRKERVKPSLSTYSYLFYYYFYKDQMDKVYHYYIELQKDGYEIPINSYRILLLACADSKKLADLKQLEKIIIDKTGGMSNAYNIVYAYTVSGNINEAERVFFKFRDKIHDETLKERLYNTMLLSYLRSNQDYKAFSLLESFPFTPTARTVEILYREGAKDLPADVFHSQYKFGTPSNKKH